MTFYLHEEIKLLVANTLTLIKKFLPKITLEDLRLNLALSKPNALYLELLSVTPQTRSQGIGTKLIEYVSNFYQHDKRVNAVSLIVSHSNLQAKKLYHKLNFIDDKTITINGKQFKMMIDKI